MFSSIIILVANLGLVLALPSYDVQFTQFAGSAGSSSYGTGVFFNRNSGDVIFAGNTNGALAFSTAGGSDMFLATFNSFGSFLWVRQFGSSGDDYLNAVSVDTAGNIYAAGSCAVGFDGNANAGGVDACIVKYGSTGVMTYGFQFGGTGFELATDIVTDSNNLFVVGYSRSPIFSGVAFAAGDVHGFLQKFSGVTGNLLLQYQPHQTGTVVFASAALGSAASVWIVGSLSASSSINFYTNFGNFYSMLFIHVAADGTQALLTFEDGDRDVVGLDIAVDAMDQVYAAGYTTSSTMYGQAGNGGEDVFLIKYANSGIGLRLWTVLIGGTGNERAASIDVDNPNQVIYVTGYTTSNPFLGLSTDGNGAQTQFLLVINMFDGSVLHTQVFQTNTGTMTEGIALAYYDGALALAGITDGNLNNQLPAGILSATLMGLDASPPPPTAAPTTQPTDKPTRQPTHKPTAEPNAEPTEAPTSAAASTASAALSVGAIVGIAIAGCVLLVVLVLLAVWLMRRAHPDRSQVAPSPIKALKSVVVGGSVELA